MSGRVVVVGSANVDLVCQVAALPAPGETVTGGRYFQAAGGKGANQAVAAARLGATVEFVARLGTDSHGHEALLGYQREGVGTGHLTRDSDAPTGVALILVEDGGENLIAVAPGANHTMTATHVSAAAAAFTGAMVVLAQLESPLDCVLEAARQAHAAGARFVLNPAPMPAGGLPNELLSQVDVLTPNQGEAARLAGRTGEPAELTAAIRDLGVPVVVLTRGAAGALVDDRGELTMVAAPAVAAVDAVGAGDAFNGALAVALSEGLALPAAAQRACAAGALAATRYGAQPSLPTRAELDEFVAERG